MTAKATTTAQNVRHMATVPMKFDNIIVDKVLCDTGSDVNVIPQSIVASIELNIRFDEATMIKGFDDKDAKVHGTTTMKVQMAIRKPKMVNFYVVEQATYPIIGFPTLGRLKMKVNYADKWLEWTNGSLLYSYRDDLVPMMLFELVNEQ